MPERCPSDHHHLSVTQYHPETLSRRSRLPDSRDGACWQHISKPYRYGLIDPSSECRLHRQWFEQSAMGDLLDEDFSFG
jgi:hypothetical protein